MRGVVLHAPDDVRVEERDHPIIVEPTDAIIRAVAVCICGSDLWPYRGIEKIEGPIPIGHEYLGVVEQVGEAVATVRGAGGTQESMEQAIHATRPGGHVGYVGVTHGVELDGLDLFFTAVHPHGGAASVRRFLPDLIRLIWGRRINPGKVYDLTLALEQAAAGYTAVNQRPTTKVLLSL